MADVKLPNISQSNLNINGTGAQFSTNNNHADNNNLMYNDSMAQPRGDGRSQSFHSGRAGGNGGNGFGQVGRSIMEAKKQRKE